MRCYAVLGACLLRWEITQRFAGTGDRLPVCSQLVLNNLRHWAAHLNNLPDDLLLPIVQVHRAGVEPCSQGVVLWNFGARSY